MIRNFTLDYWLDDGWYIGKLREVSGVFSQGETFEELKSNIKDAFNLMTQKASPNNLVISRSIEKKPA